MGKNKYEYKCPFCGEKVSSLTRHVKREHPEEIEKGFNALKEGTRQRIQLTGKSPIEYLRGKADKSAREEKSEQVDKQVKKTAPARKVEEVRRESDDVGEKPTSFLDCLDDLDII